MSEFRELMEVSAHKAGQYWMTTPDAVKRLSAKLVGHAERLAKLKKQYSPNKASWGAGSRGEDASRHRIPSFGAKINLNVSLQWDSNASALVPARKSSIAVLSSRLLRQLRRVGPTHRRHPSQLARC